MADPSEPRWSLFDNDFVLVTIAGEKYELDSIPQPFCQIVRKALQAEKRRQLEQK